jgi:hypothetical protein
MDYGCLTPSDKVGVDGGVGFFEIMEWWPTGDRWRGHRATVVPSLKAHFRFKVIQGLKKICGATSIANAIFSHQF